LALICAASGSAYAAEATLYRNGVVFSGATDHVDANWFVVQDSHFVEVGQGEPPAKWATAKTLDLGGRFVAPGFVDAHVHFVEGGLSLLQVDAAAARTRADLRAAVEKAAAAPLGEWVVVRNVGLDILGGELPTHARMAPMLASAQGRPVVLMLKGGHHVYANAAALARMKIDASTPNPKGGTIVRDAQGHATGLLVDAAAWNAARAINDEIDPSVVAHAMLAGQRLALRYGITGLGDNTFFPGHAIQYARMSSADAFHLRVSMRSFGPEPMTHFAMKSVGSVRVGQPGPRVRFFGDKYFLDASLSNAGAHSSADELTTNRPRYSASELRDLMLFATPFGTAFHTQSREGAERLVAARTAIRGRRTGESPDIIDHCGRCGGGGLPERIREAGFRVTMLPGQLHELALLLKELPADTHPSLLALRELFAAGLEPALTSDWPFGAETSYEGLPDGFHRTGLAPLASVAVAVSGLDPNGQPIQGAGERTIPLGQALLGVTAYGAKAIGRNDLGRIAEGTFADFVVLPESPFDVAPVKLYRMDALATFVNGVAVFGSLPETPSASTAPSDLELGARFASRPRGSAFAPIIGYDPVTNLLLGGAYFFYPYEPRGLRGSVQAMVAPFQLRGRVEGEFVAMRAWGRLSPRIWFQADTLRDRYYGVGMKTDPNVYVKTEPVRFEASVGAIFHATRNLDISASFRGGWLHDGAATAMRDATSGADGYINGALAGLRVELVHDTRDNTFSTRSGGRTTMWSETWGVQEGRASFRFRAGASASRFIALRAPDLVLALRGEVATSAGEHSYATDYSLGGGDLLRGFYSNRFRGQSLAAGSAELRLPIWGPLSAAAFGDVGRVWLADGANAGGVAASGGVGLRFGLPPDRLVRLRLDFGFSKDQWGVYFKFNEAF
jgi:predicted amidohydrolase YtcJ